MHRHPAAPPTTARSPAAALTSHTPGQMASMACLLEITAPKPGNVHRGADFDDLTFLDLALAAVAIGPAFDRAATRSVGATVLAAIEATRRVVATNANLGTVLLLAPLAAVPAERPLASGVADVLGRLSADDARDVYAAIRLAAPGGLGQVDEADVSQPPPSDLLYAMQLAADRDLVARQYVENFATLLGAVVPSLAAGVAAGWPLADVVVRAQLKLMADEPDSLIARKCGPEVARQASVRAAAALAAGRPGDDVYHHAVADLDFWLRADHHRRNPGTTADLIAAGLFVCLREGIIKAPLAMYGPMC